MQIKIYQFKGERNMRIKKLELVNNSKYEGALNVIETMNEHIEEFNPVEYINRLFRKLLVFNDNYEDVKTCVDMNKGIVTIKCDYERVVIVYNIKVKYGDLELSLKSVNDFEYFANRSLSVIHKLIITDLPEGIEDEDRELYNHEISNMILIGNVMSRHYEIIRNKFLSIKPDKDLDVYKVVNKLYDHYDNYRNTSVTIREIAMEQFKYNVTISMGSGYYKLEYIISLNQKDSTISIKLIEDEDDEIEASYPVIASAYIKLSEEM